MNSLLGDTFSRENNTHGSRLHDRDPQFASRILGAMTQSCYIGTRDIRSRAIRGPYCIDNYVYMQDNHVYMQDNYVYMQDIYVYMQDNYVYMQDNCVYMQDNYVYIIT